MFGGVKITLIISLTILTSCVLLISYNEYTSRYYIVGNGDNSIYIFDKKNLVLNKCGEKGCQVIETKLPINSQLNISQVFSPSKMFEADKPMTKDTIARIDAVEVKPETVMPQEQNNTPPDTKLDKKPETADSKNEAIVNDKPTPTENKKLEEQKTENKHEDEFVE